MEAISVHDVRQGDIILTFSNSWISRAIRAFLNIYRYTRRIPATQLYSHSAMVVDMWGQRYVSEALARGSVCQPFITTYAKWRNWIVLRPKEPFTKKEIEIMSKYTVNLSLINTGYEFKGIINQASMILFGVWLFKDKKDDRRVYCTEQTALTVNMVNPYFDEPHKTNPLDIYNNDNFTRYSIIHDDTMV